MRKVLILCIAALMAVACNHKLTPEEAEDAVLRGERDRLPLLVQTFTIVDDITVDSIRLNIKEEPMQGYLYTTWIKDGRKRKETPIIVKVDSIRQDAGRKGYIQWQASWDDAARAYLMKQFGF